MPATSLGLSISEESVQDAQRVSSRLGVSWSTGRADLSEAIGDVVTALVDLEDEDPRSPIVSVLTVPLSELASDEVSNVKEQVKRVWPVMHAAIYAGIFGAAQEFSTSSPAYETLSTALEILYHDTLEFWLEEIAEQCWARHRRNPELFSYAGPLPPMVQSVDVRVSTKGKRGHHRRVDFVASIIGRDDVSISRYFPITPRALDGRMNSDLRVERGCPLALGYVLAVSKVFCLLPRTLAWHNAGIASLESRFDPVLTCGYGSVRATGMACFGAAARHRRLGTRCCQVHLFSRPGGHRVRLV